jgi:lipopolysaccharide transport system ATP-binding protein
MSAEPAIRAFDLGKRYSLGERSGGYTLLSERLSARVRRENVERREFWALRDIDFEVPRGGTFGIIGHNGAGKSTLLKILSRVTAPTSGGVDLNGRVGALLEVGTGFHPELTGAENIYLNGALLGMRRQEVARRFDEIVAFAEVERFIDTPVKRYSSGMYLRLAFAVAAHLEPEILIVDEVLSVGDLAFQEKCVGRMQTVAGEGRTVLFVSHNLTAVASLCDRAMLLSGGRKVIEGPTARVIDDYVRTARASTGVEIDARADRDGSGRMRFTSLRLERDGTPIDQASVGEDLTIVLRYRTADGRPLVNASFEVSVFSLLGDRLLKLSSDLTGQRFVELPPEGEVRCHLPRCPLPEGSYFLNVFANVGRDMLDWVQRAAELTVVGGDFYGSGRSTDAVTVLVDQAWSVGAALPQSAS